MVAFGHDDVARRFMTNNVCDSTGPPPSLLSLSQMHVIPWHRGEDPDGPPCEVDLSFHDREAMEVRRQPQLAKCPHLPPTPPTKWLTLLCRCAGYAGCLCSYQRLGRPDWARGPVDQGNVWLGGPWRGACVVRPRLPTRRYPSWGRLACSPADLSPPNTHTLFLTQVPIHNPPTSSPAPTTFMQPTHPSV